MINKSIIIVLFMVLFSVALNGQMINRYGTTTANFLEIGVGSDANAMGEAYVAVSNDIANDLQSFMDNITSLSKNLTDARNKSLSNINKINWKDGFFRKDIGWRAINNK